ncbi:MAG: hypothetical protein EOQ42_09470 [Mesorhizobium sp.]|uniref:hypothetical protein n=1 Tax=Mesorhizobium sp. TaxID=1871066 RepID=UPI000FE62748|nr:hypothetical protein [Mesorhizobium sp.]RWB33388.1 MAG: hypothetical protein EOQ43_03940 [Mesorhizobium sp.]RWB77440.1 MAG: hypothetical protein EOQ42_09470 [Mesorhizobium sp.]
MIDLLAIVSFQQYLEFIADYLFAGKKRPSLPHVAAMSRGSADSRRKPLEINGSELQHGAT